jgi:hypothetical protein
MKMKKLLLSLTAIFGFGIGVQAQTARVMAIHNSPDSLLNKVDVWLVTPLGSQKLVDDFEFRKSTGFIDAPAGIDIRIAFALSNSQNITDTLLGYGFNLTANQNYLLMAMGTVSSGYTPAQPFDLKVVTPIKERDTNTSQTHLTIIHGSTDAPAVDLGVRKTNNYLAEIPNVAYGMHLQPSLPTGDYLIDIIANKQLLNTYQAPLKSLNLQDSAVVVFASGFLDPSANKNGPDFGLFACLSNGTVVQLPSKTSFKVQVFHNSPDPAAASVDIWLSTGGSFSKALSNFEFRKATGFIELPALTDISIGVAPAGSQSSDDIIYTEAIGSVHGGMVLAAVATGVLTPDSFAANPNNKPTEFKIAIVSVEEKPEVPGKVLLNAFHGATDAPAVDVKVKDGPVVFGNLIYSQPASNINVHVDPTNYVLEVVPAGASTVFAAYNAPLTGFRDSALFIVASGFLNPATNKNGAAFGLFAITTSGNVIELPAATTTGIRKNAANAVAVNIFPNPATSIVNINADAVINNVLLQDIQGKTFNVALNNNTIDVSGLNKGMYILTLQTNQGISTSKLIVE